MEPTQYLAALRRSWWLIAGIGLVGMAAGYVLSGTQTPLYKSVATVFFQVSGADNAGSLLQGSNFAQSQMRSYAALATAPIVLNPVIEELDIESTSKALATSIEASIPLDTVIVEIAAVADSPEDARSIASAVSEQLGRTVEELSKLGSGKGTTAKVNAQIIGDASTPAAPFSPNRRKDAILGLLAGLAVGAAAAIARSLLNNKVSNEVELASVTDLPLLGKIPLAGSARPQPQPVPASNRPQVEAFRRTAGNLEFISTADGVRALVITSPNAREGKSSLAANLAFMLGETRRVLLLEGDLRNPSLAERLGLEPAIGLTSVITGKATLSEAVQRSGRWLDVLAAGPVPPNPVALINSSAFARLMSEVRDQYDLVLIDGAPILPVTDSALLAKLADGALLVVSGRKSTRAHVKRAIDHLRIAGAPIHGVVLTMAPMDPMAKGGYGYYTASGDDVVDHT